MTRRRSRIALAALTVGVASSWALHALGGPDPLDIQQDTVTRVERSIATPTPPEPERHSQDAAYVEPNTTKPQATRTGLGILNTSDRPGGNR